MRGDARARLGITVAIWVLAGCGDGGNAPADGASAVVDAASSAPVDGPDRWDPTPHLLITEVALANNSREFVEIFNPTPDPIDLTNYYLSDYNHYFTLPGHLGAGPRPRPDARFDFIAKFPDGAIIQPGRAMVVAFRFDGFQSAFEYPPNFALQGGSGPTAMVDPDTFIGTEVQLTNEGECMVLFYWDGASDLVQDVDMVMAGIDDEPSNRCPDKSGVVVDGPDEGADATTYLPDTFLMQPMDGAAPNGFSHKRLEPERELRNGGGNGLHGDDETSEDISRTWDDLGSFTAPTPGVVPTSLLE